MDEKMKAACTVNQWADSVFKELNVFQILADSLPREPESNTYRVDFWYDGGDDILCRTEALADALADWLDEHGYCATTGYYDPANDEEENCVDELTGWYYVTV